MGHHGRPVCFAGSLFDQFSVVRCAEKHLEIYRPSEVIRIVGAVTTAVLLSLSIRPLYVHYGLEARMIVVNGVFVILFMCDVRLFYRLMRRREQISNKKGACPHHRCR